MQDLTERHLSSQFLLDNELSEEHLREVSRIIDDHAIVGSELGLTDPEITAISSDASTQESKRKEMLKKWKQKNAFKATYRLLIEALLRSSRADNAQVVCELLTKSKYTS